MLKDNTIFSVNSGKHIKKNKELDLLQLFAFF